MAAVAPVRLDGTGTDERAWRAWLRSRRCPTLLPQQVLRDARRLVVVAPHPDDDALFMAAAAACTVAAFRAWRAPPRPGVPSQGLAQPRDRRRFLAGIAVVAALISTAGIAAMWLPTWMIAACIA